MDGEHHACLIPSLLSPVSETNPSSEVNNYSEVYRLPADEEEIVRLGA